MLVLSRKIGERILVPNCDLAVTVLAVEGKRFGWASPLQPRWTCTGKNSGTNSARTSAAPLRKGRDAGGERDYRPGKSSWLTVTGSRSPPRWETAGSNAVLQRSNPS